MYFAGSLAGLIYYLFSEVILGFVMKGNNNGQRTEFIDMLQRGVSCAIIRSWYMRGQIIFFPTF